MNGNRNLSPQTKYGVSEPDFSAIDGMHRYEGVERLTSYQEGNRKTNFSFDTVSLKPGSPVSLNSDTSTSLLGARAGMGQQPGMGA